MSSWDANFEIEFGRVFFIQITWSIQICSEFVTNFAA